MINDNGLRLAGNRSRFQLSQLSQLSKFFACKELVQSDDRFVKSVSVRVSPMQLSFIIYQLSFRPQAARTSDYEKYNVDSDSLFGHALEPELSRDSPHQLSRGKVRIHGPHLT